MILAAFCLLFASTQAYETVTVLAPAVLQTQFPEGIRHRPAMFGVPSYASTIAGPLIYASPGDTDGCEPLNNSGWPVEYKDSNKIVMVDRGDCFFVTKVRHAQEAGATAVLVVDNIDETVEPFMADDGTGADINIPSVLIGKSDGQKLKDAIVASGEVLVSMTWSMPHPSGVVDYSLWTSSNDPHSREFKTVFGPLAESLGDAATFRPRYYVLSGGSQCVRAERPCGNLCTEDGKYCATDPDNNMNGGLSGRDIIEENTRQLCLWRELEANEAQQQWWEFSNKFVQNCCSASDMFTTPCNADTFTEQCSYNQMTALGVNANNVRQCVTNDRDEILDAEIQARRVNGIWSIPSLVINQSPYIGSLICRNPLNAFTCGPLEAICAGFASGTAPDTCKGDITCPSGVEQDPCGICNARDSPNWGRTCMGCDGVPLSHKQPDPCGVCDGDGSFDACGRCWAANDDRRVDNANGDCSAGEVGGTSTTLLAVIFGGSLFVIMLGVWAWNKRQQAHLARIDAVLQSYLPLQEANDLRTGGPNGADGDRGIHVALTSLEDATSDL